MDPVRWQRVSDLCDAALQHDERSREAFLREACAGDDGLWKEVESLIGDDPSARPTHAGSGEHQPTPLVTAAPVPRTSGRYLSQPFRLVILALTLLPLLTSFVAARAIWLHGDHRQDLGWRERSQRAVVGEVTPGGPADGRLFPGDRILAIDGDTRVELLGVFWKRRELKPGPYEVEIERDGRLQKVSLELQLVPTNGRLTLFMRLLVACTWVATGLFIGLAQPTMSAARVLALAALSFGVDLMRAAMYPLLPLMDEPSARFYGLLLLNTAVPIGLGYHAMYRFPPGVRPGHFWSAVMVGLYVGMMIHLVYSLHMGIKYFATPDVAMALRNVLPRWSISPATSAVLTSLAVSMTLLVTIRNFRTVTAPDERRRLKWIIVGIAVGLGGILISAVTATGPGDALEPFIDLISVFVPLAFAYAVVRHHVFDIAVVVRVGLQYLLARNALRVAIAVPIGAMLLVPVMNPDAPVREIVVGHPVYLVLLILAAGTLAFRTRLGAAIDRRFFREAHDREQLLQAILDDIDALGTSQDGVEHIASRLDGTLHPIEILIAFCSDDRTALQLSHAHRTQLKRVHDRCELPAALVGHLEHETGPTAVRSLPGRMREGVEQWLRASAAEYLFPMIGRDGQLRGFLMLGSKRSEEPYTPADLGLVQRIARQMAIVREHAELHSRMDEEQRMRRDVIAHVTGRGVLLLKECPQCGACYEGGQERCDADGRELTLSLPVERTLAGRYRLERLIGRGGMGAVYDARDDRLRRQVAVKLLLGRNFGNRDALRRFDREARAVARLSHPNIIAVFDYGALAGQGAFLVMERIHGRTLREVISSHAEHPVRGCEAWIEQLFDAIAAAHAHGVVHRDLKPENVIVVREPGGRDQIKVLDFGLASVQNTANDETATVTMPGIVMGTLAYMAPEQMAGLPVDERADIFSLGVIVFEILTGRRPFSANPLIRAAEVARGIPEAALDDERLRHALSRCLEDDPGQRDATSAEARDVLLPAIAAFAARTEIDSES